MGHGPSRTLAQEPQEEVELGADAAARLAAALARLDDANAQFKASRDEERFAQSSKMWQATCSRLDGFLRTLANALVKSHQLNFDVGSEGGGIKAKPWISEMSGLFDRLWFQLEGSDAVATWKGVRIATTPVRDLSYAFVEQAVVDWVVLVSEQKPAAPVPARR